MSYHVRRAGWRWEIVQEAGDGILRPIYPGLKFCRRITALRVASCLLTAYCDGEWNP